MANLARIVQRYLKTASSGVPEAPQASLRGLLGLPERVAYRYEFENQPIDRSTACLPGDDLEGHPRMAHANNPFLNKDPLAVRRALTEGRITDPKMKQAATAYLQMVERFTGWNTLGDSSSREGQRY